MVKNRNILPMRYPQMRGSLKGLKYPVFVEWKLDGELHWCLNNQWTNNTPVLMNKRGLRVSKNVYIPKALFQIPDIEVIGELVYGNGRKGSRNYIKKKGSGLQFVPFDIIYDRMRVAGRPLSSRKSHLLHRGIEQVRFIRCENENQVLDIYKKVIKEGYEGVVVKSCDSRYYTGPCDWVKLKEKDRNNFKLISLDPVRERGEVEVISAMGKESVGVKISERYKRHLKVGMVIEIEHQGFTEKGRLRHPVYIPR